MWSAPYDLSIDAARADALFASALQSSDEPSAVQVRQAIAAASSELGYMGCAGRVAQEYGEHPETAVTRMRWARLTAAGTPGGSPSEAGCASRPVRPAVLCPAPRAARDLAGRPQTGLMLQAC